MLEPPAPEAPLSAAAAWAAKRADAIERAARRRAERSENQLGGSRVDFLDRLGEAEKRDEKRDHKVPTVSRSHVPRAQSLEVVAAKRPKRKRSQTPTDRVDSPVASRVDNARATQAARLERRASRATAAAAKKRAVADATAAAKEAMRKHLKDRAAAANLRLGPATDPTRVLPQLGYEVLGPIAAGAFSTILRCRSMSTGNVVAVKSFDALKCTRDAEVGAARDRELVVLRLLRSHAAADGGHKGNRHTHVAQMVDELGDVESPHQHAVLEYVEGGTLMRALHAHRGSVGADVIAEAVRQIGSGLAHLHALEIAHRDVKPANLLLASPAQLSDASALHLKLCDFGFACVCADRKQKQHCGTPAYLAPEIVTSLEARKGYLGRPVDLWALGCVLYELAHKRPAFACEEAYELEGLIRRCRYGEVDKTRLPADGSALLHSLLTPVATRLTAEQLLESRWLANGSPVVGDAM